MAMERPPRKPPSINSAIVPFRPLQQAHQPGGESPRLIRRPARTARDAPDSQNSLRTATADHDGLQSDQDNPGRRCVTFVEPTPEDVQVLAGWP